MESKRINERYSIDYIIRDFDLEVQNKIIHEIEEFKQMFKIEYLDEKTIALIVYIYIKNQK